MTDDLATVLRYQIAYDAPTDFDPTPTPDGWYIAVDNDVRPGRVIAGSGLGRIVNGPDGTPDWDATMRPVLADWASVNGVTEGRVRLQGWDGRTLATDRPTIEIILDCES